MEPAIDWNIEKNAELKARHGFGFERILVALSEGALLDERVHPNTNRYRHQRQLVVEIEGYAWVVPFVSDGETVFLKTMFPSRKATKEYLGG
ncbi:toxin [Mesorhizobium sp. AaZ16]|uniref:toxin n=1 Tax=Mesorhizobium sp. AaZ16 TaxID=3402289 RepID=UPI00374E23DC